MFFSFSIRRELKLFENDRSFIAIYESFIFHRIDSLLSKVEPSKG